MNTELTVEQKEIVKELIDLWTYISLRSKKPMISKSNKRKLETLTKKLGMTVEELY